MAFKEWFSRRTPLQTALVMGTQPGGDLADELRKLQNYSIKSGEDAEAICEALSKVATAGSTVGGKSAFHALVGLFQDVGDRDCPAFAILAEQGIDLVVRIINEALDQSSRFDSDDVLFGLKVLAMYGSSEGTDAVLRAARLPLQPDAYMWNVILRMYSEKHPEAQRLFEALSDPLPSGFLAVSLLDSANTALRNGTDCPHPFDCSSGKQQIERWLTGPDEDHFSYAVSATSAIPFISAPERDVLLALAFDHPSVEVQLEAAWAAAKLGREAGIRWLARSCTDLNLSERARQYLTELGRADAIPPQAEDPHFLSKAQFAQWLAHPNELGRPPDEVEIVDHRTVKWPPEYEPKPMWLIKYRVKDTTGLKPDDVGVGLVGSVTFCLFTYKLEQRPPEDCYAIHCYWEMTNRHLITESDVSMKSSEYDQMWRQCKVEGLKQESVMCVAEMSPELKYPQRLVALAKATRHAEPGWAVLDGLRSRWYSASDMPADHWDKLIMMIHVGRVLLGFTNEPDRRKFLQPAAPERSPEDVVAAYERILYQAATNPNQSKRVIGGWSVLGSEFPQYVSALAATSSQSKAACTCKAYESILSVVEKADPSLHGELLDSFSPLGQTFDKYVDALIEMNRQSEVPALLEKFRPHWDHNLGYGKLGGAAFKSGHYDAAEYFIVKLRHHMEDWCRSEEIGYLAEIWKKQGRVEDAHTLLIDALKGLIEQSRTATGSDCRLFEEWFQTRRATYLRLFPDRGEAELRRHGIMTSTLAEEDN